MTYAAADLERIFGERLRAIAAALNSLQAEFMLIGGLAVGVWAEPRATKDADLSVHVVASHKAVREALLAAGLEVVRGDLERALEQGESVRLKGTARADEPVVIDLLIATTPFEIDALRRRTSVHVMGIELPVASPEDLFVFKIVAGRPQDLADAALLFEMHGESFDAARVHRWCSQFGVADRLGQYFLATPP